MASSGFVVGLVGGPCDGTTRTVTQAVIDRGQLTCKNVVYVKTDQVHFGDLITFATQATIAKATKGPSTGHVTLYWTRWMRGLGRTGPQAHNRIMKATRKVRRIAR